MQRTSVIRTIPARLIFLLNVPTRFPSVIRGTREIRVSRVIKQMERKRVSVNVGYSIELRVETNARKPLETFEKNI